LNIPTYGNFVRAAASGRVNQPHYGVGRDAAPGKIQIDVSIRGIADTGINFVRVNRLSRYYQGIARNSGEHHRQ
jgi:hypothetical protein